MASEVGVVVLAEAAAAAAAAMAAGDMPTRPCRLVGTPGKPRLLSG